MANGGSITSEGASGPSGQKWKAPPGPAKNHETAVASRTLKSSKSPESIIWWSSQTGWSSRVTPRNAGTSVWGTKGTGPGTITLT